MWSTHTVQFVWFVSQAQNFQADEIFEQLLGKEPDGFQRNKNPSGNNPLFGSANGVVDDAAIEVRVQPGRIDVILSANEADEEPATFPIFDGWPILEKLVEAQCPLAFDGCTRVAISANFAKPIGEYSEGVEIIESLTGFKHPVAVDSDFLIQLNSRKDFESSTLNRLIRYSISAQQKLMLNVNGGVEQGLVPASDTTRAVAVLCDVNLKPTGEVLDKDARNTIFGNIRDELFKIGQECTLVSLEQT